MPFTYIGLTAPWDNTVSQAWCGRDTANLYPEPGWLTSSSSGVPAACCPLTPAFRSACAEQAKMCLCLTLKKT